MAAKVVSPNLHSALKHNDLDLLRALLAQGADANKSLSGEPPLLLAASLDNVEAADLLLRHGADLNQTDREGTTAVMVATKMGYGTVLEHLLANGAEVDAHDKYGYTAIMIATMFAQVDLMKMLVRYGANLAHRAPKGESLLDIAYRSQQHTSAVFLLDAGLHFADTAASATEMATRVSLWCEMTAPALHAADRGNLNRLTVALNKGADPNTKKPGSGETLLIVASRRGDAAIVDLLLARGALVDKPSAGGWTPLMMAIRYHHGEILRRLLAAGANPAATSIRGLSCLQLAERDGTPDSINIIQAAL